jgi:CubicO group peptidase (beta-lactamase class C family)
MTSGFACDVSDGEKALSDMRKSKDWIKFIFDLPMSSKPGESFSYCSCNFYLLSEIIYRVTGLTPHEFAKIYLFEPLQINESKWLANYKNINHGWGDLFLLPVDMAKIGKLVLDKGKWQNKQVISEQWINKALQTYTKLSDDKGYSYGWWTNDKVGYYEAAGRGRQTISVIPSKNMIVTMLGGEFDAGTIGQYVFRSIQSEKPLPENKQDCRFR